MLFLLEGRDASDFPLCSCACDWDGRRLLEQVASLFELAGVEKLHGRFKATQLFRPIVDRGRRGARRGGSREFWSLDGFGWLWFGHSPVGVLESGRRIVLFGHNSQLSSGIQND